MTDLTDYSREAFHILHKRKLKVKVLTLLLYLGQRRKVKLLKSTKNYISKNFFAMNETTRLLLICCDAEMWTEFTRGQRSDVSIGFFSPAELQQYQTTISHDQRQFISI